MSTSEPLPAQTAVERWRTAHWSVITGLLIIAVAVGWWTRSPEVSIGGDEATYVTLSQSLENGRYHDEFLRGTPRHAKYPPGNPLWIATVRQLAGPDLEALRAANLVLLLMTALIVGDGIRRLVSPWFGVAGVGLTALNAGLLELAGTGLSEIPFTFLVAVSLWSALRADERRPGPWTLLSSFAAMASFLTRTIGLATIGSIGLWLLYKRRWGALAGHVVASATVVAAWFFYTNWASTSTIGHTYGEDLRHIGTAGEGGLAGLLTQVGHNATAYLRYGLPWVLSTPSIPATPADNVLWAAILATAGVAGIAVLTRQWLAAVAYLVLSAGALAVWPWPIERLLAPLVPVIVTMLLGGGALLTSSRKAGRARAVALALAASLCASGVMARAAADRFHRCSRQNPYTDGRCYDAPARGLVAAARFLRDSLPSRPVVSTAKPATVHYFSDATTVPMEHTLRLERATGTLDLRSSGVDLVLLSLVLPLERETAARTLLRYCDRLSVEASFSPGTLLLRPKPAPGTGDDACHALREYRLMAAQSPAS